MSAHNSKDLLSGEELVNTIKIVDPNLLNRGLKLKVKENTPEENEKVLFYQNNLRQLISQQRIDKKSNRSKGIWKPEENYVQIITQEGNWNLHGFVNNLGLFVEPHEALYLMEINRLEIYYDSVIMSLEQAYLLFLSRENSLTSERYSVYCNLMRKGYILIKYKTEEEIKKNYQSKIEKDNFVWNHLFDIFNGNVIIDEQDIEIHNYLKKSIENIKEKTINSQIVVKSDDPPDLTWNSKVIIKSFKKKRIYNFSSKKSKSLTNYPLLTDMKKFKNIFNNIQLINLRKFDIENMNNESLKSNSRTLKFDFNLFLPNRFFKKSEPGIPNYRIIVLKINEQPISGSEIIQLYQMQIVKVPIIVIIITEVMNYQAFIYNFSSE